MQVVKRRGPGGGNGAVMHSAKEGGDQKAHDLFVGDGPAVRIGGVPELFRPKRGPKGFFEAMRGSEISSKWQYGLHEVLLSLVLTLYAYK